LDVPTTCMPADFERQSGILLGANELLPHHPQELVGVVAALIDQLPLFAVITGEAQRRELLTTLCDWGLAAHRLRCVSSPAIGLWVRDYGPSFVRTNGRVRILDAEYFYPNRPDDDRFPTDFAGLLGVEVCAVPLVVEGGNLLSNGAGLGLCSTTLVHRNAQKYGPKEVSELLLAHYGFRMLVGVRPLIGGPTPHVDMFAAFTSADTLVLGKYDPADDPENARQLDELEALLRRVNTPRLNVVRIPMPPHHDNIWRTYTNVIFANDVVVVPTYAGVDPGLEREALDIYRNLLPDRDIITVEATSLAKTGGVLRCVSQNIPHVAHSLRLNDWPRSHLAARGTGLPPGTSFVAS
jgi:agmatine/peptidylarginine deiminase